MKVLLVKCHKRTIFSLLEPIVTEPLELEYLSGLLKELKIEHKLYDPLLEGGSFQRIFQAYKPELLLLTGYITAVDTIISYSQYAKSINHKVRVVVGGVHAEINYEDFFVDTVDFIVHSDGINTLEKLIKDGFDLETVKETKGIAFFDGVKWQVNSKCETCLEKLPLPNRAYFENYKARTKYLHYSPIALVRTALSCPFNCNFCYCKLLNRGTYATRSIESVVEEIKLINSEYIWLIDDSFLLERERVLAFIKEIKSKKINKKFIAYSRVDFIVKNEDLISELADIGFIELIIGMESVDDQRLKEFNKHCSAYENLRAAEVLAKKGIRLTGLFIVGIDFTFRDFRSLSSWIKKIGLDCYAVSIFTPIKGTEVYKQYKNQIQTKDYSKYDFLHLTLRPLRMSPIFFYLNFNLLYLGQFFRSKHVRSLIYKTIKRMLSFGGKNE